MVTGLVCVVCGTEFSHVYSKTKTCSLGCRNKRNRQVSGRGVGENPYSHISTGTVGAISEMAVSIDLLKKGYAVFRALSPACFCDLIAIKDTRILRVEARTGYEHTETKNFTFPKALHGTVDIVAVRERRTDEIRYFDVKFKQIVI